MSKGKAIYQSVCDAPDLEQAIAKLPRKAWRRLFSYLVQGYDINGVSGQVLAVMYLDAAARVMKGEGKDS